MIATQLGISYSPEYDQVISNATEAGRFLGGILYTNFTGASVWTHMASASPRWLNRQFLWMIFDYPFNQLGVNCIFAPIPATNRVSLEITRKMGFKVAARIPDVYRDGDMTLMVVYREEAVWLSGGRHGRGPNEQEGRRT